MTAHSDSLCPIAAFPELPGENGKCCVARLVAGSLSNCMQMIKDPWVISNERSHPQKYSNNGDEPRGTAWKSVGPPLLKFISSHRIDEEAVAYTNCCQDCCCDCLIMVCCNPEGENGCRRNTDRCYCCNIGCRYNEARCVMLCRGRQAAEDYLWYHTTCVRYQKQNTPPSQQAMPSKEEERGPGSSGSKPADEASKVPSQQIGSGLSLAPGPSLDDEAQTRRQVDRAVDHEGVIEPMVLQPGKPGQLGKDSDQIGGLHCELQPGKPGQLGKDSDQIGGEKEATSI